MTYFLDLCFAVGQMLNEHEWRAFFSFRIFCCFLLCSSICLNQVSRLSLYCALWAVVFSLLPLFQVMASFVLQYGHRRHHAVPKYPGHRQKEQQFYNQNMNRPSCPFQGNVSSSVPSFLMDQHQRWITFMGGVLAVMMTRQRGRLKDYITSHSARKL